MTAHRWLAFALVVLESLTLAVMSATMVYPFLASAAALAGAMGYFCRRVSLHTKAYTLAGGAVLFGGYWWLGMQGGDVAGVGDRAVMETIAMYLIFAQLLDFFMEETRPRTGGAGAVPAPHAGGRWQRATWSRVPWGLPFSGVVVMACASHSSPGQSRPFLFLGFAAVFSILFTLFYAVRPAGGTLSVPVATATSIRRRPWLPMAVAAVILAAASGLGVVTSVLFQKNLYEVDRFFYEMISPRDGAISRGFSDQARLDSIQQSRHEDADAPVVRVEAAGQPGYLRAYAYNTFDGRDWKRPPMSRKLHAAPAGADTRRFTYVVRGEAAETSGARMRVWPDASIGGVFPLPGGAMRLVTPAANVMRDEALAVAASSRDGGRAYHVDVGGDRHAWADGAPDESQIETLTTVPATLDPRVHDLATSVTRGCATATDRIAAVERHFARAVYRFGIMIPRGEDPMSHFLLTSPPAHCEFYASGAAILLRLAGVPARYVTGFVVTEKGLGGHWVGRNRDAHAWVEAWNGSRWVVVECTPGDGIPGGRSQSLFSSLTDMAGFVVARAKEILASLRFDWLANGLRWVMESALRMACAALALLALFGAVAAVVRRLRRSQPTAPAVSPAVRQLRCLLARLDRHVARWGVVRRTDETLVRFADRLDAVEQVPAHSRRAAAAWYRAYAAVRYLPDPATEEIDRLAAQADEATGVRHGGSQR